jgi:hypothetical protein
MTRTINADPYGKIALQGYDPVAVELLRASCKCILYFGSSQILRNSN